MPQTDLEMVPKIVVIEGQYSCHSFWIPRINFSDVIVHILPYWFYTSSVSQESRYSRYGERKTKTYPALDLVISDICQVWRTALYRAKDSSMEQTLRLSIIESGESVTL